MNARNHHFVSQVYLRGFTNDGTKNGQLVVLDQRTRKSFTTVPRNVGSERDFNRVDIEGVDPEVLENDIGKIEAAAGDALTDLVKGAPFDGKIKESVLTLAAFFHIRSPARREQWRGFRERIAELMMAQILATPERYEQQTRRMKEDGVDVGDAPYEEMRDFFQGKQYTVDVPRESHIRTEFVGIEAVLPLLMRRHWIVLEASAETGPFVTCDHPVNLTWRHLDEVPMIHRDSPGHGMPDTRVWFPLTHSLALLGEFDSREGRAAATPQLVASFNSLTAMYAQRQIYAPTLDFRFVDGENHLRTGHDLLAKMQEQGGSDEPGVK
jgi:hypothetical protein